MDLKIYTVSNVNKYIKLSFDNDSFLKSIAIKGEITNFKAHQSGHLYFTLKDELSTIKCVMFKNAADKLNVKLADGDKVIIVGTISVYEAGGTYQVYVRQISQDGLGDLYKNFEELKKKLSAEGLFDESHKRKVPYLPNRVGVITSSTGSVIRDIINVSTRRFEKVNLLIYPATVQGENTAKTVIDGIKAFNSIYPVDVIIIARGGGSFEDLFGFNDEGLAREIYASEIPIISAVGHETDFTICDFVSDLRAPTPSAAAELVYPMSIDIQNSIELYKSRIRTAVKNNIESRKKYLSTLTIDRLQKCPRDIIAKYRIMTDNLVDNIKLKIARKLNETKMYYQREVALLDSFSPLKTLSRGYSVITDKAGKVILKTKDVNVGDNVKVKVTDGTFIAEVNKIN